MKSLPMLLVWGVIVLVLIATVGVPLTVGPSQALPDKSFRVVRVAKDGASLRVAACSAGKPCGGAGTSRDFCVPAGKTELRDYLKTLEKGDIVRLGFDENVSCASVTPASSGASSPSTGGSAPNSTDKPAGREANGPGSPTGSTNAQGAPGASNRSGANASNASNASSPVTQNNPAARGSVTTTASARMPATPALQSLEIQTADVPPGKHWLALGGAAAFLLLLTWGILRTGLRSLILGADNRYSKSKFQLVVWFGVLMITYLSALWLRFYYSAHVLVGGINIPSHLLEISGLSALTFAGAKAITQTKENRITAAAVQDPILLNRRKIPAAKPYFLDDLTRDDTGQVDLGDFQMVFLTIIAALTYLTLIFNYFSNLALQATITLPDVDTTILSVLGLGQGAYLIKKLASGPNPPPPSSAPAAGGRAVPPAPPGPAGAAEALPPDTPLPVAPPPRRVGEEA
jgi:hypothetical protein